MTTEEQILSVLQAIQAQNVTFIEIGESTFAWVVGGFAALVVIYAFNRMWRTS